MLDIWFLIIDKSLEPCKIHGKGKILVFDTSYDGDGQCYVLGSVGPYDMACRNINSEGSSN